MIHLTVRASFLSVICLAMLATADGANGAVLKNLVLATEDATARPSATPSAH